jgi:methenyltetrahydrofolate cyclohydrolase
MTTFADLSVTSFLDALASSEPTPGGGTASAVAGAMGASLLMMVAGLAKSRNNTDEEKAALANARTGAATLRSQLLTLADDDAAAFNEVMAAFKLPKATDEEKAARTAAVQAAFRRATEVPFETLRVAAATLAHAEVVADGGNRSATSDVGVAVGLLEAAAAGATMNVLINLGSLKDRELVARVEGEVSTLNEAVAKRTATARASLV